MIHNSSFFDNIGSVLSKYPNVDFSDVFSKGQMQSKRWLINELEDLKLPLGVVFVCAGWYGSLSAFLLESGISIVKIRSFDIDNACAGIADSFNRSWVMSGWKFKASTLDILEMNFPTTHTTHRANGTSLKLTEMPDTVINTSCEHIKDFNSWYSKIPNGTLVVLQSNDYYELAEHINCSRSLKEFSDSVPMSTTLYEGELELEKYTRFMKIGTK